MNPWRQPVRDVAAKLLARARRRGVHDVAALGRDRLKEAWSSRAELVFCARPCAVSPDPPEGLEVRPATAADGPAFERYIGSESRATFRRRLEHDGVCLLALEGEAILHASWLARGPVWTRELRLFVGPPVGDAYIYESFTTPAARGRGVYPLVLNAAASLLARSGVARLWVAVEADNAPSLRAVAKAGFSEEFRVSYRRRAGVLRRGAPRGRGAGDARAMLVPAKTGSGALSKSVP